MLYFILSKYTWKLIEVHSAQIPVFPCWKWTEGLQVLCLHWNQIVVLCSVNIPYMVLTVEVGFLVILASLLALSREHTGSVEEYSAGSVFSIWCCTAGLSWEQTQETAEANHNWKFSWEIWAIYPKERLENIVGA